MAGRVAPTPSADATSRLLPSRSIGSGGICCCHGLSREVSNPAIEQPGNSAAPSDASLYDEARAALIVPWEAPDRVCGKRLKALLPILLPALERNRHLNLDETIRPKILAMSASTNDGLLRTPRKGTRSKKPHRVVPEPHRRIPMRTFADWHEPPPGSMEMDFGGPLWGGQSRGSYVHTLILTDIASGWTEAAPFVVREGSFVVETLERIRVGLPFVLRELDVDNGSEFVNDRLIENCLSHGVELTCSRPYRKNGQAWVERKNGAIVRKLLAIGASRGWRRPGRSRACMAHLDCS